MAEKERPREVDKFRVVDENGDIDPEFVGVDPEMAWLIDHDHTAPDGGLTAVQRLAAGLIAEIIHPEYVDDMLRLSRGTVRAWAGDEGFRKEAIRRRRAIQDRPEQPAYEAVLTHKQFQAALMEARGASRLEVAEAVGCHRSTLHNWSRNPAYRHLVERLAGEMRTELAEEGRRHRREELDLAHESIVRLLSSDDLRHAARLAVAIVKAYELDPERLRQSLDVARMRFA